MFLEKYFSFKSRYWYVLAVNSNIDTKVSVPAKLKAIAIDRDFKVISRFAQVLNETLNDKQVQVYTVIKTPCHVQILGTVPSEQIDAIMLTDSQIYQWTKSYMKGTLDLVTIGPGNVERIKKFLDNPTFQ